MGYSQSKDPVNFYEVIGLDHVDTAYTYLGKPVKNKYFRIKCTICGTERIVLKQNIRDTVCQSETCKKVVEAYSNTRLYRIWCGIKGRCYCKTQTAYKKYGAKGIRMCDEWLNDYKNFYDWAMSNGYNDTLSIDRKNSKGNYEPNNCRWATNKQQHENRQNTIYITVDGTRLTMTEWAKKLGIAYQRLYAHFSQPMKKTVEEYIKSILNKENTDV